ncbi:MAG TPA: DNA recombination protein RmuC, partial [Candidatus Thermoplasmatota archaeon]
LRAEDETTRGEYKKQFLRDVRTRIKEVTDRTYIDPAGGTVDCTIVFIPNEQIFEFIQQQDGTILDEALRKKVVLCSPLTLYAVLAIIRQAVDNFRLEQASNEILALLGTFAKQWANYKDEMAKVGKQMQTVLNTFQSLEGTRTRQLEKPLDKIENIRQERGIATDSEAPALRQLSDDGDEG